MKPFQVNGEEALYIDEAVETVKTVSKGLVSINCAKRIAIGTYKGIKNFYTGNTVCGVLCLVSIGCEVGCAVIVWFPLPKKIKRISILKSISTGFLTLRDIYILDIP